MPIPWNLPRLSYKNHNLIWFFIQISNSFEAVSSFAKFRKNGTIFKESIRFSQKKNSQNSCSKSDDFQLYRVADFYQDIWDLYSFFHAKNLLISLKVSWKNRLIQCFLRFFLKKGMLRKPSLRKIKKIFKKICSNQEEP